MPQWQNLFALLREHGISVSASDMPRHVGGGSISAAWQLRSNDGPIFLKTGTAAGFETFLAEAQGLQELADAGAIRVPAVLGCVASGNESLLALEWIELEPGDALVERRLGERLATLHRRTADRFGWHRDNTIGSTPQPNTWCEDWISFFAERRLGFQLELAARNGYRGALQSEGRRLIEQLGRFFAGYWPDASLLHGDLWGGNWAACAGEPVVFDPAVYYGDREADLAMTRLFGGFGREFYAAYETAWPLAAGHEERLLLYQLYHVLNHLNLFGAGYLARAERIIRQLL